jgi:hypothetical protein
MMNKNPRSRNILVVSVVSFLMLALGFIAGGAVFYRIDETFTTKRFVEDRLSQCAQTIRISELSNVDNKKLHDLLMGDLRQCKRLIEMYSYKLDNETSRDRARRLSSRLASISID